VKCAVLTCSGKDLGIVGSLGLSIKWYALVHGMADKQPACLDRDCSLAQVSGTLEGQDRARLGASS